MLPTNVDTPRSKLTKISPRPAQSAEIQLVTDFCVTDGSLYSPLNTSFYLSGPCGRLIKRQKNRLCYITSVVSTLKDQIF